MLTNDERIRWPLAVLSRFAGAPSMGLLRIAQKARLPTAAKAPINGSMNRNSSAEPTFGYLDFLEDTQLGVTGGYLIVSSKGRPLEFHCTAPVTASRAQEILFGPTLRPHLLGERVGATLVNRATLTPSLVAMTDADLVAAVSKRGAPAVLVHREGGVAPPPDGWQAVESNEGADATAWLRSGDAREVTRLLEELSVSVELAEPFERIREAIREAQRLGQGPPQSDRDTPIHEAA